MVTMKRTIAAAVIGAVLGVASAAAAADTHVRGTITDVSGSTVTIKTREGKTLTLALGDNWKLGGIAKASIADIKPGTFIGTANMAGPSGAKAIEVVVFPDAMRGAGEGDYGWDLQPNSSMTNATVSNPVQDVDGQTVTLSYKGGQKKVTIPPTAPIVMIVPATKDDVKPGAAVFIAGKPEGDSMMSGGFLAVGKDGVIPPM